MNHLFVGRRDILKMVEDNLGPSAGQNILVLRGQRRSGKTSVLMRLHETLASTSNGAYLPVFVDLQGLVRTKDEGQFFHSLAHHIWRDLNKLGVSTPKPALADFAEVPTTAFEMGFLEQVETALAGRRILLMLDEFEKVTELIDRGTLNENLLDYFRHLMQHSPLLFLIAGTQKLRELTGGYWSVFFNLVLTIDIGVLQEAEARWLITEPIRPWYRIEPEGVGEIIRVAGCHPYFTQMVCRTLLDVRNEGRLRVLTLAHVRNALDRALKSGDEQIGYPWTEEDSRTDERLVLAVLAREGVDGIPVAPVIIRQRFERAGLAVPVEPATSRLQMRGVLRQDERGQLAFTVPLFQKWLVRKSYDNLETASRYNRESESSARAKSRLPG
jgi:AAA ATPase domain